MAKIVHGMGSPHVPSIGAAIDHHKEAEEYWKPFFDGIEPVRDWHKNNLPDTIILVYNDHASTFSLQTIPTFALGLADEFEPADEGYGPRPVPVVKGDPELAWHLANVLVSDEGFDLTLCNELDVDHGLTVPLSIAYNRPEAWPVKVIPLAVNMVQAPQPSVKRCYALGKAIARAVASFPGERNVAVWGTGGMSHQLQGERAGLLNVEYDAQFIEDLVNNPDSLEGLTYTELLRETGSEGVELAMWMIMRGALQPEVQEQYRFMHRPVSNTSYGVTILKNGEL